MLYLDSRWELVISIHGFRFGFRMLILEIDMLVQFTVRGDKSISIWSIIGHVPNLLC